ncbi:MAG: hypothetical protein ABWZ40_14325 [Caulobacterales bacterium]
MAALGVAPIFVEENIAAAACSMRLERFQSECPIPGIEIDRRRLLPLDEVRAWAFEWWRVKTGARSAANNAYDNDFEAAIKKLGVKKTPGGPDD